MRTSLILVAVAVTLMLALPMAARAQATGACLVDDVDGVPTFGIESGNGTFLTLCTDGLSEQECLGLCGPVGDDPGGIGDACQWLEDQTCASTQIPWDGACDGIDSPIGNLCILLQTNDPDFSQMICESKGGGTWLGDGSVCGGVPAMPKLAYGALALVLLAGTLALMTLQNRS